MDNNRLDLNTLFSMMFQAHPWHGIAAGPSVPEMITAFIEIVPNDTVKYELDKKSGRLRIDRPQRFSSLCPMPYGFIPQTFCGGSVAEFSAEKTGLTGIAGDDDPLDVCVLTERTLMHGNCLLTAKPIGGLRMIDRNEADDKIIAVLLDDAAFGQLSDIGECPPGLVERLQHYFLSYKQLPTENSRRVSITHVFGREEAFEVIERSRQDYRAKFGNPHERARLLQRLLQNAPPDI